MFSQGIPITDTSPSNLVILTSKMVDRIVSTIHTH